MILSIPVTLTKRIIFRLHCHVVYFASAQKTELSASASISVFYAVPQVFYDRFLAGES